MMRTWLVTARDGAGKFIDQREIKATGQGNAESDAYDWIKAKGWLLTDLDPSDAS